jgi:hypothetical protein
VQVVGDEKWKLTLQKFCWRSAKTKAPNNRYGAFVLIPVSLCGLCGSLSFCPPLFHHFRNTSLSSGAKTTTATPPAPAIAWPGLAAAPAVSTFQSRNGLLQSVSLVSHC